MTQPATQTRVCESCFTPKPIGDFRLRHRGGLQRMRQCRQCHNDAERSRRLAKQDERLSRQLATVATEQSNRRVVALTDRLLTQFGGMDGFISEWQRFYARSSSLDQMRCLKAVLSLVRVAGSRG